ncbi:hypothetical protein ACFLV7_15330 [Chloroflexota bacterium]
MFIGSPPVSLAYLLAGIRVCFAKCTIIYLGVADDSTSVGIKERCLGLLASRERMLWHPKVGCLAKAKLSLLQKGGVGERA